MKNVLYKALDGCTYSAPLMNTPVFDLTDYTVCDNWGTGYDLLRVWQTAVEAPATPLILLEVVSRWAEGSGRTVGKQYLEASASDMVRAGRVAGCDPDENPLVGYVQERAS